MAEAVARLEAEIDDVKGVVIASAKKTFFAGGNLRSMVQAGPDDAEAIFTMGEAIKDSLRRLERYPRPVVAAINGAALGGGFEIALAANRRIVVDDPRAEVGLPEASLGLLPGGGGVTRVVRMLGLQHALMDVLLPVSVSSRRSRCRSTWSTSWSGRSTSWCRPRRRGSSSTGATTTWRPTRGTGPATGCPAARRSPRRWRRSFRRSRRAAAAAEQGRALPAAAGDPVRRRSRARRSTSTPRPGSSRATSPS